MRIFFFTAQGLPAALHPATLGRYPSVPCLAAAWATTAAPSTAFRAGLFSCRLGEPTGVFTRTVQAFTPAPARLDRAFNPAHPQLLWGAAAVDPQVPIRAFATGRAQAPPGKAYPLSGTGYSLRSALTGGGTRKLPLAAGFPLPDFCACSTGS